MFRPARLGLSGDPRHVGETGLPSQLIWDRAVWPLALGRCFGVFVGLLVSWDPMVGWSVAPVCVEFVFVQRDV